MKKILILILLFSFNLKAQKLEGVITYKHTYNWVNIIQKQDYLSKEEKDRIMLNWANEDGYSSRMDLFFNNEATLYTRNENKIEDGTFSWREDEYWVYMDLKEKKIIELNEMLSKTYIIEGDLPKIKWKILNELKEIDGHMCMKASTQDSVKNYQVEAWFASDLPISSGPEGYYGLPGLILELNLGDGDVVIETEKIEFKSVADKLELPKKMRGKKISPQEKSSLIAEHIDESTKNKMNPYWAIRY